MKRKPLCGWLSCTSHQNNSDQFQCNFERGLSKRFKDPSMDEIFFCNSRGIVSNSTKIMLHHKLTIREEKFTKSKSCPIFSYLIAHISFKLE